MTEKSEKLQKYIDALEKEADLLLPQLKQVSHTENYGLTLDLFSTTVHSLCFALAVQDQLSYEPCDCDDEDKIEVDPPSFQC